MGEHSANKRSLALRALDWVRAHKRLTLTVSAVALPVVARYVPGFPSSEVLSALRLVLGVA